MATSTHTLTDVTAITHRPPYITMAVFGLIGLVLLLGGGYLSSLGGSLYYIFAGLMTLATTVLLKKRPTLALWLFSALLVITIVWSLWEVIDLR